MPADADPAEYIVGFLDAERAGGVEWTAADLNEKMQAFLGGSPVATVTSEQLTAIRQLRDQLFARWRAVPPGSALELEFTTG